MKTRASQGVRSSAPASFSLEFLEDRRLLTATLTYPLSYPNWSSPLTPTYGSDNLLYYSSPWYPGSITRINGNGSTTEFAVGATLTTRASDGNIWFTAAAGLGKLTPGGVVSTYNVHAGITSLVGGNDGKVWFTSSGNVIGHVDTDGTGLALIRLPRGAAVSGGLAVSSDGSAYFKGAAGGLFCMDGSTGRVQLIDTQAGFDNAEFFQQGDGSVWLAKHQARHDAVQVYSLDASHVEHNVFALRGTAAPNFVLGGSGDAIYLTTGGGGAWHAGTPAIVGEAVNSTGVISSPFSAGFADRAVTGASLSPDGHLVFDVYGQVNREYAEADLVAVAFS
jgi:streptogramin lyase